MDYFADVSDWIIEHTEVIIEEEGITDAPIRAGTIFPGSDPGSPLLSAQFKYAVRVDKQHRYNIRVYSADGDEHESDWLSISDWYERLYVDTSSIIGSQ